MRAFVHGRKDAGPWRRTVGCDLTSVPLHGFEVDLGNRRPPVLSAPGRSAQRVETRLQRTLDLLAEHGEVADVALHEVPLAIGRPYAQQIEGGGDDDPEDQHHRDDDRTGAARRLAASSRFLARYCFGHAESPRHWPPIRAAS